jgi:Leucine-rich repeat (LRR) protein
VAKSAKDGWLSIEGPFESKDIKRLKSHDHIEKLSLTKQSLITAKIANGLNSLSSVTWLWLWCSVTRTAMRNVVAIPDLEVVDILEIRHPGKLTNFQQASNLKTFRCNHYMTEADLLEISNLPTLQELGAQNSAITPKSLEALLCIPTLEHIDLEATEFNDSMAATVAESKTIKHLEVGATQLTSEGLGSIAKMEQLQSLDIWAVNIAEKDLEFLFNLPNLEYLSIGGVDDQASLTAKGVLPRLKEITSLKKVWLDGIILSQSEASELKERYEYFRN